MTKKPESLDEFFDHFETEAFRLETLDDYGRSGNWGAYQKFLAGEQQPPDYNHEWVDWLTNTTQSGKRVYRVHILTRPLTPYLQYELGWGYHKNATGGEEFFILDLTEKENPLEGVGDFWLFDNSNPVVMLYDNDGGFIGGETVPSERSSKFVQYKEISLRDAQPFTEWWTEYGT